MSKKILTAQGKPFEKVSSTQSVGVPGYAIYGGYIDDQEKNPRLKGQKKYVTYSEALVNTAIVAAGVRYFLNLVAKASWTFKPADDSAKAKQVAELIEEAFGDMDTPFIRVVRRSAMYKFYGYSISEWTAKNTGGFIGFKDIAPRPNVTIERWGRDEKTGEITEVIQRNPQNGQEIYIPRAKLLYVVDDSLSDSPEGIGLLRHIVPHSDLLATYQKLEAYGMTTDLRGIPIVRAPLQALESLIQDGVLTEEQRDLAIQQLKDFVTNHNRSPESGLLLDSLPYLAQDEKGTPSAMLQWTIELLKGDTSALPEIAKAINRLNHDIARILGVEQLLLGSDSTGSHALSKDKTHAFFLIIDSTLTELAQSFEHDLIPVLMKLNGIDESLAPKMIPEPVKFMDVIQITEALRNLASAGAVLSPDDEIINFIRGLLGAPLLDLEALMLDASLIPKDENPEDIPKEENEGEVEDVSND